MTAVDMQCIHKKILFVHQPTYPQSASLCAQPYEIVIALSGIWCTVNKSSIHFRFEKEYEKVRGQIEVSKCWINIATCLQPNKWMYSNKFMTTTLKEREFIAPAGDKSFKNMKKSVKSESGSWIQHNSTCIYWVSWKAGSQKS